ncbi:DUF4386 domain-containing protein [Rhodanobacter sp. BL-MT-08]
MESDKRIARTAGLLYLVVVIAGIFSLVYVPSQIDTHTDPLATAAHITASASLFRWGALSELIMVLAFLLLPLALYRLLHRVNRNLAGLMVLLVTVSVPISIINVMHKLDILSLLGGGALSQMFTNVQLSEAVMMHLLAYRNGMLASEIFSGLWLLPFGYLVLKSRFLPRTLGTLLMLGGFGYLIDFCASLVLPGYGKTALPDFILLPASVGEIGICLWLIIVGTRQGQAVTTRPWRSA